MENSLQLDWDWEQQLAGNHGGALLFLGVAGLRHPLPCLRVFQSRENKKHKKLREF